MKIMTTKTLKERLKTYVAFMRIPLIFRKNLALFAIGALLMTTILSASISFLSGISEQELYLGREENVVILAQPGATTPVTGSVPIAFEEVLKSIPGVEAVSPETLGIGILSTTKESITYRGITESFFAVQSTKVTLIKSFGGDVGIIGENELEANDFFNLFSEGSIRGVIVGKKLVEEGIIKLNVDRLMKSANWSKSLSISATITDARFDLEIVGIFETNTKLDEEILIPLPLAQSLSGLPEERVTLHRIRINPNIVNPKTMERLISSPVNLKLHLNFTNAQKFDLTSLPLNLLVRTPDGALVEEQTITSQESPLVQLSLYIGIYELELRIGTDVSAFTTITIGNQTEIVESTASSELTLTWNLEPPIRNYNLEVYWNGHPLPNTTVQLRSLLGESFLEGMTDSTGVVTFNNVAFGTYRLLVEYATPFLNTTVRYHRLIELNQSVTTIRVHGNGQVVVSLVNATTSSIPVDWDAYEVEARLNGEVLSKTDISLLETSDFSNKNGHQNWDQLKIAAVAFNSDGKAVLSMDPGIYDIYLKKNGVTLMDRIQSVVIGDAGFNDTENVKFVFGKIFLNVTINPINVSLNLVNHEFNITVFKQFQNKTLIFEKSEQKKLISENETLLVEVNASNSLNTVLMVQDMNVSLSNGVSIEAMENMSLEIPLASKYQVRFQLQGIFDKLEGLTTLPIEVTSLFPQSVSVEITRPSLSSMNVTLFQNYTALVSTTNLWELINVTIKTYHHVNDTVLVLSEKILMDPYKLYLVEKITDSPVNVTYGGIVFNRTFQDALTNLKVGAESLEASYLMKNENGDDVKVTTKIFVEEGKVIGYIPSVGRINYTLLFKDGTSFTFWNEYRNSRMLEGFYDLELPSMILNVVDLDGLPISEASYEIYQLNPLNSSESFIVQKGYLSSDGQIQLQFFWNASKEYRLVLKIGTIKREVTLGIRQYQPEVSVPVSIHYKFIKLRNPYKFISTSNIFIGDVDAYLNEVFEGSILVLQLTIYVMIGILGILGGFSVLSLVSYPLAQHRRHFNIVRVIGGVDSMVATSTMVQLTSLAALMTLIGIILGNIAMIAVTKLSPTNIAGLVIEPNFDFASQFIFFLVITLTVSVSSFSYTLQYMRRLTLRGEIKEDGK